MTTRRAFLLGAGIGLVVAYRPGIAQPATTVRRVGWLASGSQTANPHLHAAFTQGMRDLGWVEGKNVEYLNVYADNDVVRLDALAREMVGQQVDVILVSSSQSANAAHRATKTIPIVLAGVANAVGAGLVVSLAKPGGNITGFTSQQDEVLGKLIGILHEVAPAARRIAILLNESSPLHARALPVSIQENGIGQGPVVVRSSGSSIQGCHRENRRNP